MASNAAVVLLLAVGGQARTSGGLPSQVVSRHRRRGGESNVRDVMDTSADRFLDAVMTPHIHDGALDKTMLGKSGQGRALASPSLRGPPFPVSWRPSSFPRPAAALVAAAALQSAYEIREPISGSLAALRRRAHSSFATKASPSVFSESSSGSSREERIAAERAACKSMRVSELRTELEALGISTASFFEKSEFVKALAEARADGRRPRVPPAPEPVPAPAAEAPASEAPAPVPPPQATAPAPASYSAAAAEANSAATGAAGASGASREERIAAERSICNSLRVAELKKELQALGISTSAFFEKSEFVNALAEARADGITARPTPAPTESSSEFVEAEVVSDDSGPRKSAPGQGAGDAGGQQFAGGMPGMGGMGGMPGMGGMGGMGGIADMFKNMGGMGGMGGAPGGAGGNPFAGAGGAPGGNPFAGAGGGGGMGGMDMGKIQQMMSNPKVREIMAKAQSNPKILAAAQECMSNPAAFAKYANDPEVGELIRELQKYM